MSWIIVTAALVVAGYLLDREIYFYEGAHLGPRLQAWLYDRWSKKYDQGKRLSQLRDDEMLAQPLLEAVQASGLREPLILDFATGTGRLSQALLSRLDQHGHIIALDLSRGMLEQAAAKLASSPGRARVELLRHTSLPLPFPDATFDVVCALEVLELFPAMDEPLRELGRVLRPGGILLTSRGTEESGRTAKVKSKNAFTSLLSAHGFEQVAITPWWKLFDRVLAVRHGESEPAGARTLSEVMRCPGCKQTRWQEGQGMWKCGGCGQGLPVTKDGIVLG
jgi:ubiquinone/menaquinone biosynthesis C-methylase UbiE